MRQQRPILCLNCGYDLRGLTPTGRCPECGTPVQVSLRPPLRWPYGWTVACALALAMFHLFVIGLLATNMLVFTHGGGSILLAVMNYPIAMFLKWQGERISLWDWSTTLWFFGIWGTLMYALFGASMGLVIDARRRSRFRSRTTARIETSRAVQNGKRALREPGKS